MELLVYKILKEIEQGKASTFSSLGVEKSDFFKAVEYIKEEQLATNIAFSRGGQGNRILIAYTNNSKLTEKGRKFIKSFEDKLNS